MRWRYLPGVLLLVGAGRGRAKVDEAPPPAPKAPKLEGDLWPAQLPFDPGPTPAGLFGPSAQVCAACHPSVARTWSSGAHARGPSAALVDAAAGRAECLGCHLPLVAQADGPTFDATLVAEGVTCVACHARSGQIVVDRDADALRPAPHPMVVARDLASSEGCAACHQLTWPGASEPLYDTFGEWKRAGFDKLGLTCEGCHLVNGADGGPTDHAMTADLARALTVELKLPSLRVVRGAAPVAAAVVLTNTGAGHSVPTGSPFRGLELEVGLVPPEGPEPPPIVDAALRRTLEEAPPFAVSADTRLGVGESRRYEVPIALPIDAPAGDWSVRVTVRSTVRGRASEAPVLDRGWHLVVE
jgi:hypothetical protein